jgi:type IV pilus assembly protein PilW
MPDGSTKATGLQGLAVKYSDVLVVHGTLQTPAGKQTPPTTVTAFNTGSVTVNDATGFQVGGLAVVSDCAKAEVFQITGITGQTISFAANATMSMGNTSALIPFSSGELFIPTTSIYFVGVGSDGDGALMRGDLAAKNDNSGTYYLQLNEIVPDVENMQILYGVNPAGAESATSYVTADQAAAQCPGFPTTNAASFNCVRSVQIGFVVASPLQTVNKPAAAQVLAVLGTTINAPATPTDTRQRTVYQVTVALRNTLP